MVSKPDTKQCANEDAETRSGVDTGRCSSEDTRPQKGVDYEIPHRLEKGTNVSEDARP